MDTRLVAAAIPIFMILIAAEWAYARAKGRQVYRLFDAISDLSCGISQQLFLLFSQAPLLAAYAWLQTEYGLVGMGRSLPVFLLAYLVIDHQYYWWHRASHRVNFMWAAHVVHHQSEDYNLAVALRQSMITHITSWPFYLPLALLGFDAFVFGIVYALNTLYQFWIHTELVGKLGPLEEVLNTPSHHRVHHGINGRYIDKNYAGFLITWDRLYGTFEEEEEPVVFGITKPLNSFNPFWANCHYWLELWHRCQNLSRWSDKIYVWFAPPEWRGFGEPDPEHWPQTPDEQIKFETHVTPRLTRIIQGVFAALSLSLFVLILKGPTMPWWDRLAAVLSVYLLLWMLTWGQRPTMR